MLSKQNLRSCRLNDFVLLKVLGEIKSFFVEDTYLFLVLSFLFLMYSLYNLTFFL